MKKVITRKQAMAKLEGLVRLRQTAKDDLVDTTERIQHLNTLILNLMTLLKMRETKLDGLGKVYVIQNTHTTWDLDKVKSYYKKHNLKPPVKLEPKLDEEKLLEDIKQGRIPQKALDTFAVITKSDPYVKIDSSLK